MTPHWDPLIEHDGKLSETLKKKAAVASGAYAVRDKRTGGVVYVGESSTGNLWKTMLREAQAEWIARFEGEGHELLNQDDGRAELEDDAQGDDEGDDSFAFGAAANPPPLGPNVAAEKLAANRTPDLFTGRTKLEEGGKGARRDWKSDAERAARELAECRRAGATPVREIEAAAPPPPIAPPLVLPDGYGMTDERGQSTMFRRNPVPPAPAAELDEFLYWAKRAPIDAVIVQAPDARRTWELKHDGRIVVFGLATKDLAEWVLETYRAAELDARLYGKVTELVGAPPTERGEWLFSPMLSGEGMILVERPDDAALTVARTDRSSGARFLAQLANLGQALQAAHATHVEADRARRALAPSHRLRVGDNVEWRGVHPYEHRGTVDELVKGDKLIMRPWFTRKVGGKQWRLEQGNTTPMPADMLTQRSPPEPKSKKPRAPRAAKPKAAPPPAPVARPAGYGDVETKGKRAGQIKMFNPGAAPPVGKLTELGILTELGFATVDTRKAIVVVLAWSLRDAPVLAYDTQGRLFIVYAGKVARPSSRAELEEYARTHWGAKGRGDVRDGGRAVGPFRTLGRGTSIQYTTKKGSDRRLVNYVHEWGEGGSKAFTPPAIVEHDCKRCGPRCGARGALALSGGSYVVNDRGIVG